MLLVHYVVRKTDKYPLIIIGELCAKWHKVLQKYWEGSKQLILTRIIRKCLREEAIQRLGTEGI